MSPNTEWQIKDVQTGTINSTYLTNFERFQSFTINPSTVATPVVTPGATVVTPVITPGGTIYSGPIPGNPPLGTLTPNTPVVASAKDSIFKLPRFQYRRRQL